MTDALLDEATRLLSGDLPYTEEYIDPTLRALVERVQQTEAERQEWADLWQQASMSVLRLTDERDAAREDCNKNATNVRRLTLELHEARGKLDKVRAALTGRAPHSQVARDVLAILDDQTGVGGTGCASLIE